MACSKSSPGIGSSSNGLRDELGHIRVDFLDVVPYWKGKV